MVAFSRDYLDVLSERFEEFHDSLLRRAYKKFGFCCQDAEDCLQEAYAGFVDSFNNGGLDPNQSALGYFKKSFDNACRDFARSRKKSRALPLEDASPEDARTPLSEAAACEGLRNLEGTIDRLRYPYSMLLRLHFMRGLGRTEIARALNMRPNAVSVSITRAKEYLRRALAI